MYSNFYNNIDIYATKNFVFDSKTFASFINKKNTVIDFKKLISKEAKPFLPQLMQKSKSISQERFGKNIALFAPLYLSNECNNICTYCGFSFDNKIKRKTLTDAEILQEANFLKTEGFDSVLLVTGESNHTVGVDYLLNAIELLKPIFSQISIEVQPLEITDYLLLKNAGVFAVFVYQETYNREIYKAIHPKGKKSNFEYRLDTPDRLGEAAINKIGLGVLLGLDDWRNDSLQCALHLDYLQKKYWKTKFSISFPRIRPFEGEFEPKSTMTEKDLVQLICAYRICFPDVEISISTRETATFRNAIIPFGITTMSAGSKTEPGGYTLENNDLQQFEIDDDRTLSEIKQVIKKQDYEPVLKDWDLILI